METDQTNSDVRKNRLNNSDVTKTDQTTVNLTPMNFI